jgi:multiple sugar transport system ATP-binding protein
MAGVLLDDVTKRFGSTVAVDHLTLDIADGEFLVLLGPSGCGKSTVLRMIAGLDEPTDGAVRIDGDRVDGVDPKDRDLAMVFQSYALYPNMTVRRNIAFPLKPRGVSRREAARRVDEAAEALGLLDLLDRKPGQLSGGQRQRVALARAIVRRPRVFLMDEPLSNLDAKLRTQTRRDLVDLHRTVGTTFVYVTHDQAEAMTMADRVALLSDGRLQQLGTPQEVYDRPANVFVARFLGSPPMNVLPGMLDGTTVVVGGARVEVSGRPTAGQVAAGLAGEGGIRRVDVGIRPEHLRLVPVEPGGTERRGVMAATFDAAESLGHERLLRCHVDGGAVIVRAPTALPVPGTGARLAIAFDVAHLHLFDADTGERLDDVDSSQVAPVGADRG